MYVFFLLLTLFVFFNIATFKCKRVYTDLTHWLNDPAREAGLCDWFVSGIHFTPTHQLILIQEQNWLLQRSRESGTIWSWIEEFVTPVNNDSNKSHTLSTPVTFLLLTQNNWNFSDVRILIGSVFPSVKPTEGRTHSKQMTDDTSLFLVLMWKLISVKRKCEGNDFMRCRVLSTSLHTAVQSSFKCFRPCMAKAVSASEVTKRICNVSLIRQN